MQRNKTNKQENNEIDEEITYSQPYEDTAMIFNYNEQQIIIQFSSISYGADTLKSIIISNGIPVEFVIYCSDESNDDTLFNNNLVTNKGQYYQYEITIPNNYNQPYYPYVMEYRKDYNLDHGELPIIIPIPINREIKNYNVIYVNQYYRGNVNDRIKFIITA